VFAPARPPGTGLGVQLTHPDKVLFPEAGISKADFAAYIAAVAPTMLPHVRQRPLMLQRYPRGVDEPGFVQKDFGAALPSRLDRVRVAKADGSIEHPLANSRRALVWLANQNCITVYQWLSRAGFDEVREFARDLAQRVAAQDPDHRTVEMRKHKRAGRVHLDIMRNAYAQTAVARLQRHGDPWARIGRHARTLTGPRRELDRIRARGA
jgi:bifunctional non-homologous end joining protein LigD